MKTKRNRPTNPSKRPGLPPSNIYRLNRYILVSFLVALVSVGVGSGPLTPAGAIVDSARQQQEYRAGVGFLQNEQYGLARRQFQEFLEKYPDSALVGRASLGLARADFQLEQYENALEFFLQALREGELESVQQQVAIGQGAQSALLINRYNFAEEFWSYFNPDRLSSYEEQTVYSLGRLLKLAGMHEEARRLMEHLVTEYPSDRNFYERADLAARSGNYSISLEWLDKIKSPDSIPEAQYLRGEIHFQQGNLDRAQEQYQSLLDDEDFRHDARYGLAWIDIERENWDEAGRQLEQVANEANNDLASEAMRDRARLARMQGSMKTAIDWYERAFERVPPFRKSELALEIGDYLVAVNKIEDAVPYYESVEDRPLKARKHLVRGYFALGRYDRAREELETMRDGPGLPSAEWSLLMARAYLHTGSPDQAEQALPDVSKLEEPQRREAELLKGRIYIEREEWNRAVQFFQDWRRDVSKLEGQYFLGMVAGARGDTEEAHSIWQSLVDRGREPWKSRAAAQILRSTQPSSEKFTQLFEVVREDQLTPDLRLEFGLIKFYRNMHQLGNVDTNHINQLVTLGRSINRLPDVFPAILELPSGHSAWSTIVPRLLKREPELRTRFASRAVRGMIQADQLEKARQIVAMNLNTKPIEEPNQTELLLAFAEILEAQYSLWQIEPYIPREDKFDQWTGLQAEKLGHLITRLYRNQESPTRGRQLLTELAKHNEDLPQTHARLQEWIAGFEIDMGRFNQAENRLASIPSEHQSRHGRLNLALASYHQGDPDSAFQQLNPLLKEWPDGPIRLYEYYLRSARHLNKLEKVQAGYEQLLNQYSPERPKVQQLMLDTSQFWMSQDNQDRAISILDRMLEVVEKESTRTAVKFYRATVLFNQQNYQQAASAWKSLDEKGLESPWRERVLQQLVEVNLQTNQWDQVFTYWKRLDELGKGGEIGKRILSTTVLKERPEDFRELIRRLEEDYSQHLTPGEVIYWRARMDQRAQDLDDAIFGYRQYVENNYEAYRSEALQQLANLYLQTGDQEQALETWDQLWRETGDLDALIDSARVQRKHGNRVAAYERLKSYQSEVNPKQWPRLTFELGMMSRNLGRWGMAQQHFQAVRTHSETSEERRGRAGFYEVEALLNQDKIEQAGNLLEELPESPHRQLISAEWHRRRGELEEAREIIDQLRDRREQLTGNFRTVAIRIFQDQQDYEAIVELLGDSPDDPGLQEQLMAALIELDRLEEAKRLFHRMDSEAVPRAAQQLADALYEREQWSDAKTYYLETKQSPRQKYRLGKIALNQDQPQQAWDRFAAGIKLGPDDSWLAPLISEISKLVPELERWNQGLSLLGRADPQGQDLTNRIAQLGLWWGLQSENDQAIDRYLTAVKSRDWSFHDRIGRRLKLRQDWSRLETWHQNWREQATDAEENELLYETYEAEVRLRTNQVENLDEWINERINRALEQNSPALPRYHRLLGEWAMITGDYEKAAIEFTQVVNGFDDPIEIGLSRLGLAESYIQLQQPERAKSQLRNVVENNPEPLLKQRAQQRLDQIQ